MITQHIVLRYCVHDLRNRVRNPCPLSFNPALENDFMLLHQALDPRSQANPCLVDTTQTWIQNTIFLYHVAYRLTPIISDLCFTLISDPCFILVLL